MAKWCMKHGMDNPDCDCDPFKGWRREVTIPLEGQPTGVPTRNFNEVGLISNELVHLQFTAFILHILGYETELVINYTVVEPGMRKPREVMILFTNAPLKVIWRTMWYVAGASPQPPTPP